ncbi:MAG: hypothetical protein ACE5H4_15920 [Candidatus Thorarchaeota archaeon]
MIRYKLILREEYVHGDRMRRENGLEQRGVETERFLPPGLFFLFFPALLSLLGVLILTQLPWLIMSYNYLRGFSSPIDQAALALLGSDLARLAVLSSSIIGMMIGLLLFRSVSTKLDTVREKGEAELGVGMYLALFAWWNFLLLPFYAVSLLESVAYGPTSSHFLSDLHWFANAGYLLAFAIPVLVKYVLLFLHAKSIGSRVTLISFRSGTGTEKRFPYVAVRVIPDSPGS